MRKNLWVGRSLLIGLVALTILVSLGMMKNRGLLDKESGISIEHLNEDQVENLHKLCKVWGFVKYHHPKVIAASVNWDYELFRIIPKVIEVKDSGEVDKVLYNWVNNLGKVKEGIRPDKKDVMVTPDIDWIKGDKFLSKELSDLLVKISKTYISKRNKAYTRFEKDSNFVDFKNEKPYPNMQFDDDGYKLLSLFRYWNIIEYYYPYRTVMGEDWDGVLTAFIPRFVQCRDSISYKLTVAELTTKIHDSHGWVRDYSRELEKYWGYNVAPIKFQLVENKIVVTDKAEKYAMDSNIQKGDIILKIHDKDVFEVIKERSKYISASNDKGIIRNMLYYLFRTSDNSLILTLERDGKTLKENINCYNLTNMFEANEKSHRLLEGNIGYINPGALEKGEIDNIMSKYRDTKGLIVDLRHYPSDFIVYSLGNYLMAQKVVFSKVTVANPSVPGEFVFDEDLKVGSNNPNYYKGKVIIIINESTQSQAEFTTMALRKAPNAQVIGSNSSGTDGNIAVFRLPGGIETAITGVGIYYPDKSETQRVGLSPDIYIEPTIQGIKEGRDELLEKALELIIN
ncbi:S41 family peptidase [Geosporobacter ferrireducens]|uniref:S41 family peptidase n=1 Tax=Geosporobacter ferrireducens TaxID=1424294 RepID=UPI00139BC258|nr:S41 family peptidase [Geosporobacter ferrireducens]MTI57408.1 peptidase S41 [Geosporobacter ferrireducens]